MVVFMWVILLLIISLVPVALGLRDYLRAREQA